MKAKQIWFSAISIGLVAVQLLLLACFEGRFSEILLAAIMTLLGAFWILSVVSLSFFKGGANQKGKVAILGLAFFINGILLLWRLIFG